MRADSLVPPSPLHDAVTVQDIDAVRHLLDQGHDVNGLNLAQQTPLTVACGRPRKPKPEISSEWNTIAEDFLRTQPPGDEGERIKQAMNRLQNQTRPLLQQFLDRAFNAFRPEALQRLERRLAGETEADPDWQLVEQTLARLREQRATHRQPDDAPIEDDPAIAHLLLDRGADIEGQPGPYGRPLAIAARCGRLDTIRLLLARGAEIGTPGRWLESETPLTAACAANQMEAVGLLIEQGADWRQQDGRGDTGLHATARNGHIAIMRLMLSLGLEVDQQNGQGVSPLAFAAMTDHTEMVSFLRDKRAAVRFLDAVALGDLEAARRLPSPKIREQMPGWAFPVVRWAIRRGNNAALPLLVERGLSLTLENPEACALLRKIILSGNTEGLRILWPKGKTIRDLEDSPIEPGMEPGKASPDQKRMGPLRIAIFQGDHAMVRALIRLGADCNETSGTLGPLGDAVRLGDAEMVQILLSQGTGRV